MEENFENILETDSEEEEGEIKVYKIYEKENYEENKNEIYKMTEEFRKNGYVYIEAPEENIKYNNNLYTFAQNFYSSSNPRYNIYEKEENENIPNPPKYIPDLSTYSKFQHEIKEEFDKKDFDNELLPVLPTKLVKNI